MSTKIYNGYKIPAYNPTELMKFLHGFRDGAQKHLEHFLVQIDEDPIPTQTLQVVYEVIAT